MNCVIPSLNIKVLGKGLQSLAKVGDELFMECKKDIMSFVTLNQSKTVCVRLNLLESFFSTYEIDESDMDDAVDAITCKIHMKILLPLFKGLGIEKKLDFMRIEYKPNSDVIFFKMKYKTDDILMTHTLHLLDSAILTIGVNIDSGSNNMCASSSFYNNLLSMFSTHDDEITFEITKDKLVARNYILGAPHRPRSVRSQVTFHSSEFMLYRIERETSINFSLKPFRTAIHFGEGFNINIGFNFEKGGKPLAIIMKNPIFELNFIVASIDPYSDSQTTMSTASIPAKITPGNQDNVNLTLEDQQALANENWDDFEMDEETSKAKTSRKSAEKNTKTLVKTKTKDSEQSEKSSNSMKKSSSSNSSKKLSFKEMLELKKRNKENVVNEEIIPEPVTDDCIPASPESPRSKRAKLVFGRCIDPTFSSTVLGDMLVGNSDSE